MELDYILFALEMTVLIIIELLRRNNKNTSIVKKNMLDLNLFIDDYLKRHLEKSSETYVMVKKIYKKIIEDEKNNRV